jgi:hypothetical protein
VDCAVEALRSHGCITGLVNAGGDLRVFGARTEPLFLRGPAGELTRIELADAALAVSDADSQRRPAEHQGYYIRGRPPDNNQEHKNDGGIAPLCNIPGARRGEPPPHPCAGAPGADPSPAHKADAIRVSTPSKRYAAVIAKEAVVADALTKCVMLCPNPTAGRVLQAYGATQPIC